MVKYLGKSHPFRKTLKAPYTREEYLFSVTEFCIPKWGRLILKFQLLSKPFHLFAHVSTFVSYQTKTLVHSTLMWFIWPDVDVYIRVGCLAVLSSKGSTGEIHLETGTSLPKMCFYSCSERQILWVPHSLTMKRGTGEQPKYKYFYSRYWASSGMNPKSRVNSRQQIHIIHFMP